MSARGFPAAGSFGGTHAQGQAPAARRCLVCHSPHGLPADGRSLICEACAPARLHTISMQTANTLKSGPLRVARCSCGWQAVRVWRDASGIEAAIRAHWRKAVQAAHEEKAGG